MNGFSAFLLPTDVLGLVQWGEVPAGLRLDVRWYRSSVRGGPSAAEIEVSGGADALRQISNWLRRPVEIRNAAGTLVWWGYVEEVRREQGVLTAGLSLDSFFNAASVVYSTSDGAGGSEQVTTDWTEDAASIARFGRRERRFSAGESTDTEVAAMVASALAVGRYPSKAVSLADVGAGAQPAGNATGLLACRGWWETLDWRLFSRAEGRFEYEGDAAGATASIGWYLQTDRLGFRNGVMDSVDGYLHGLYAGAQFTISGFGANYGVRTVVQGTNTEAKTFSAGNVTFELSDDVLAGDALPSVTGNALIEISDTAFNNGIWWIDGTAADRFTVSGAGIWSEAEGTATFKQGNQVKLNATASEIPNRTPISVKTIMLDGQFLAQSFVPGESVTVDRIALKIGRHGMPVDNLSVAIHAAGAGIPGAVLVAATVAPGTLTTNADWKWIGLPALAVTAGTTYWIVVTRTGATVPDAFFKLGLVTPVTGSVVGWNGSAWVAYPTGQSIAYKVWAGEDTTAQIGRIIGDASEFISGVSVEAASGVTSNPYREGSMTAGAEIEKLLDLGTAAGRRLLAEVTDGRTLRLYHEPLPADSDLIVRTDGTIGFAAGAALDAGVLPHGRWVSIEGADHNLGDPLAESPIFIDEAEYDVERRQYRMTPRKAEGYAGQ